MADANPLREEREALLRDMTEEELDTYIRTRERTLAELLEKGGGASADADTSYKTSDDLKSAYYPEGVGRPSLKDLGIQEGFPGAIVETLKSEEGRARLDPMNSILEALSGLGTFAKNVAYPTRESGEMLTSLARMGLGGLSDFGDAISFPVQKTTSPDQEEFRQVMDVAGKKITDPDEFAKDPLFGPSLLAAPVPGSSASKAAATARMLDPVHAITKGAELTGRGLRKAAKGGRSAVEQITGLTSGVGGPRAAEAGRAGRAGEGKDFRQSLRAETTPASLGADVAVELDARRKSFGEIKGAFLEAADEQNLTVDISALKRELMLPEGPLGEMRISAERLPDSPTSPGRIEIRAPASFTEGDKGAFATAVEDILNSSDRISVRDLDEIKMGLDNIPTAGRTPKAARVIKNIRAQVRALLGPVTVESGAVRSLLQAPEVKVLSDRVQRMPGQETRVAGAPTVTVTYNEAIRPIADFREIQKMLSDRLGRSDWGLSLREVNEFDQARRLEQAFDAGPTRPDLMEAIDTLDELLPNLNIRSRASGMGFTELQPNSIVGRREFMQLVRAGAVVGVGGAAAYGLPLVAALPIAAFTAAAVVPKSAGRVLSFIGWNEGQIKKFQDAVAHTARKLQEMGVNTQNMTLGQMLGRVDEMREQGGVEADSLSVEARRPDILGSLGGLTDRVVSFADKKIGPALFGANTNGEGKALPIKGKPPSKKVTSGDID